VRSKVSKSSMVQVNMNNARRLFTSPFMWLYERAVRSGSVFRICSSKKKQPNRDGQNEYLMKFCLFVISPCDDFCIT
jgi:hypothetical protein